MTHHKWGAKERPSSNRSLKHCRRCGVICLSLHEIRPDGRDLHWREYWRGTDKLPGDGTRMPVCELAIDQDLEEAA